MRCARVLVSLVLVSACGPKVEGADEADGTGEGTGEGDATRTDTTRTDGTTTAGDGPVDTSAGECTPVTCSSGDDPTGAVDTSGLVLLAVSMVLQPTTPFQYVGDLKVADGQLTITLQPLSLDIGSTTAPRQYYGDPLSPPPAVLDGTAFSIEMGTVVALGATNPITGADVTADLALPGRLLEDGPVAFCGEVRGQVTAPIQYDLIGSTFAATWIDDPNALPVEFAMACP